MQANVFVESFVQSQFYASERATEKMLAQSQRQMEWVKQIYCKGDRRAGVGRSRRICDYILF